MKSCCLKTFSSSNLSATAKLRLIIFLRRAAILWRQLVCRVVNSLFGFIWHCWIEPRRGRLSISSFLFTCTPHRKYYVSERFTWERKKKETTLTSDISCSKIIGTNFWQSKSDYFCRKVSEARLCFFVCQVAPVFKPTS